MARWEGLDPRVVGLMLTLAQSIQTYTGKVDPDMPASLIIEALCFTAGSAMAQPEMVKRTGMSPRKLRELGIDRIDKGIESAKGELRAPSTLILPNGGLN